MQPLSKYSSKLIEFGIFTEVSASFNKGILRFVGDYNLDCAGVNCNDCPLDESGACANLFDEPAELLLHEFATITKISHPEYFI